MSIDKANFLIIDTASPQCAVLAQSGNQVFEFVESEPRQHAESLLPMIDEALNESGLTLAQLDAIGVNRGPGAFTSLRIGISAAQGLAFSVDKPVLLLSSLAAWAVSASSYTNERQFWVLLDARMNEVYAARWQLDADNIWQLVGDESVIPIAEVDVNQYPNWHKVGSGWSLLGNNLVNDNDKVDHEFSNIYHPRSLLELAQQQWRLKQTVDAEQVLPVYLRNHVADKMVPVTNPQ
ncbi:MAG: tRNA (adenosine(37)-N6)-threonylcarbamoyltransferase complex dimerization subunit type 1 TsaB [Gammaproteobacteria bacterium]|nr:tRNA (adenosine(37)-N6)-threonylcarbamoyltransferase complex dimerization subunit type 1 TsaB [Gammaproteobacteria bacterium]